MAKNKKFSVGKISEPVTFDIDDDTFEAIPSNRLPAGALAKYFDQINDNRLFDAHDYFFQTVLTEDSSKKFFERMESIDNPITVTVMGDVASWLLGEVYMQGEASAESKPE